MGRRWLLPALALLLAASLAAADIVGDVCSQTTNSPSFDELLQGLRSLQASPRVTVSSLGTTRHGRPIALVVVRDPEVPLDQTVRIFLIARQHGTEASGTVACLAFARHFATSKSDLDASLLKQLTLVMVPVANPDGMAGGQRANGGGRDLNRSWANGAEPEIVAIKAAVRKFEPHALIDMHELPAVSGKPAYRDNFIQTIGRGGNLPADLTTDCAVTSARLASWLSQSGFPVNVYYDSAGEATNLCHRYFGLDAGIPSFLFEAKCGSGRPLAERVRLHVTGTLVVANYALHRYYCPDEPTAPDVEVPMAAAPQPAPVAPTVLTLGSLQPEQVVRGQLPIVAGVTSLPPGGYVSFAVDGRIRSLTTSAPHQYLLDTRHVGDGCHEIAAEAYDADGRSLSVCRNVIVVDNKVAAGE